MATKKVLPKKTFEDEKVDTDINQVKLESTNEIADNIIDIMNLFFNLNKISIDNFNCAEYERLNYQDSIQAKELLSYILSVVPYFKKNRIGLNTNSKGIITSVYLLDRESSINVVDKYLI